jgi:hypothetical protein
MGAERLEELENCYIRAVEYVRMGTTEVPKIIV